MKNEIENCGNSFIKEIKQFYAIKISLKNISRPKS